MNAIGETRRNHYNATLTLVQRNTERIYDLNNASMIMTELNLKIDEVWSHGPHRQMESPYPFIICTTLNLSFVESPPNEGHIYVSGIAYNVQFLFRKRTVVF